MASQPRGERAVQRVDPALDALDEVVHVADPEEVARTIWGAALELGGRPGDDLVHLRLVLSERPADCDSIAPAGRDGGRGFEPKVPLGPALDDPVDDLPLGTVVVVPAQATLQPAVGALHRVRRVVPG